MRRSLIPLTHSRVHGKVYDLISLNDPFLSHSVLAAPRLRAERRIVDQVPRVTASHRQLGRSARQSPRLTPAYSVIYSPVGLPTNWPTCLLACALTGQLACWPAHLLAYLPVGLPTNWPTCLLACLLVGWPTCLLACLLVGWPTGWSRLFLPLRMSWPKMASPSINSIV